MIGVIAIGLVQEDKVNNYDWDMFSMHGDSASSLKLKLVDDEDGGKFKRHMSTTQMQQW